MAEYFNDFEETLLTLDKKVIARLRKEGASDQMLFFDDLSKLMPKGDSRRTSGAIIEALFPEYLAACHDEGVDPGPVIYAIADLIPVLYSNASSQIRKFSYFRDAVRKEYPDAPDVVDAAMRILSSGKTAERNAQYKAEVAKSNFKREQIDAEQYDSVQKAALDADNVIDDIIVAIMATGSRIVEVLGIGEYTAIDDLYIRQVGIAKKTGGKYKDAFVIKPVIGLRAPDVVDIINGIRASNPALQSKTLKAAERTNMYDNKVNKRIRKLFGVDWITAHKLRAAYGSYSYKLYADQDKITLNAWLSSVLGHESDNIETAASYAAVNVKLGGDLHDEKDPEEKAARRTSVIRGADQARRMELLDRVYGELLEKGIKPTHKAMKQYGFGTKVVSEYLASRALEYNDLLD